MQIIVKYEKEEYNKTFVSWMIHKIRIGQFYTTATDACTTAAAIQIRRYTMTRVVEIFPIIPVISLINLRFINSQRLAIVVRSRNELNTYIYTYTRAHAKLTTREKTML